jgi:hypothetical protein
MENIKEVLSLFVEDSEVTVAEEIINMAIADVEELESLIHDMINYIENLYGEEDLVPTDLLNLLERLYAAAEE